jgi:membrane protein DedA with SNARE-associated domain
VFAGIDGVIDGLVAAHGGWIVAAVVGLESMGLPLPGETVLVSAALYAGTTGRMSFLTVVVSAAIGGIAGDNLGFWIGRDLGYPWMRRHTRVLHLTPGRLKLGQYLFHRHGGKVVFFGRFIAVLRTFAALLAGVNRMEWKRFLLFNAAGAAVWAAGYGSLAYMLGQRLARYTGPLNLILLAAAAAAGAGGLAFARRHERQLEDRAERALPGPTRP